GLRRPRDAADVRPADQALDDPRRTGAHGQPALRARRRGARRVRGLRRRAHLRPAGGGRAAMTVVRTETIVSATAEAYRGTFAVGDASISDGQPLPPGWEGVYFPFAVPLADLRPDGTPARDGVVPETDLPRRMYAGETTEFLRPLLIGDEVTQVARLGSVVEK